MSLFIIEKDRFLYGSKSYTATEIINFTKKVKINVIKIIQVGLVHMMLQKDMKHILEK